MVDTKIMSIGISAMKCAGNFLKGYMENVPHEDVELIFAFIKRIDKKLAAKTDTSTVDETLFELGRTASKKFPFPVRVTISTLEALDVLVDMKA